MNMKKRRRIEKKEDSCNDKYLKVKYTEDFV